MLVLTRKSKQSIMIGDEIEISILGVSGQKVRLGIRAPRSVPVFRKEVYVSVQNQGPGVGSSSQDSELDGTLERLEAHE